LPLSKLAEAVGIAEKILKESPFPHSILGHVADGNFHTFIVTDPTKPEELNQIRELTHKTTSAIIAMGGTCTGEHGIGAGKIDSPSGTAVRTAELMAAARADKTQPLIPGVGQEARGQVVAGVPIHSIRLAGVSAKQDVLFGGDNEVLSLHHEVTSTRAYIAGILLCLRHAVSAEGLLVGLQSVVEAK
ncbi:MAG: hypothetical protein RLZ69_354, partial [Actinomycetota bacterium]